MMSLMNPAKPMAMHVGLAELQKLLFTSANAGHNTSSSYLLLFARLKRRGPAMHSDLKVQCACWEDIKAEVSYDFDSMLVLDRACVC